MNDETKSPQIKSKSTIKNRIALAKTSLTIGSILALLGGWVALAKTEPSVISTPVEATANQPSAAVQPQSNARNRPGAPPERSAPRAPAVQGLPTRPSVNNDQANTQPEYSQSEYSQPEYSQPEYSQPEAARGSVVATPVPQATQAARPTAVAPAATPRAAVAAQPAPQARAQSSQRPAPSTRTRSSR